MQVFKETPKFPFMRYRMPCIAISLAVMVWSIYEFVSTGAEKYGVDFLGGTEIVARFDNSIRIREVRKALSDHGINNAVVQAFETDDTHDFSIRVKANANLKLGEAIQDALSSIEGNKIQLLKEDFVGPVIGEQIKREGMYALTFALIGILIYISARFELRFALGAIAALVHDVIIATGVYVLSGREISAAVLAALLTVIGYSLNDTIIVYDRIRENLLELIKKEKSNKPSEPLEDTIDRSINETLSRTLLTSLTTIFVVTTLWLYGGGAVEDLAFTLVVGIAVGTYSSIFIAAPVLMTWRVSKKK